MCQEKRKQVVVNIYGASGVGKSILATTLTNKLKMFGVNAEYCREWVKEELLSGVNINKLLQAHITSKQSELLKLYLNSGCDVVVTDSPLFLGYVYGIAYNDPICIPILNSLKPDVEEFNILLAHDRDKNTYQKFGRVQNYEESLEIEKLILDFLEGSGVKFTETNLNKALQEVEYLRVLKFQESLDVSNLLDELRKGA